MVRKEGLRHGRGKEERVEGGEEEEEEEEEGEARLHADDLIYCNFFKHRCVLRRLISARCARGSQKEMSK